jgi:putative ABC transport system permease protein
MNALRRWLSRLGELGRGRAVDAELSDEVQSHIDHLTDEYVRRGLTRDNARRAALRDFGAVEGAKESVRDARGIRPLETLVQDTRYAIRLLIKTPTFSIVAILTLALGIGANTAIFSLVDAVMLRPLPYSQSEKLVSIWEQETGSDAENTSSGAPLSAQPNRSTVAPANLVDYQTARNFAGLAGVAASGMNLTGQGDPEHLTGEEVTWNYFDVLGARPALGRVLQAQDDHPGAEDVIVLGDGLWRRRFNADPSIVDRSITLDGRPARVIGVMPREFRGITTFAAATNIVDYWVAARYPLELLQSHGDHEINVIGRLRDGARLDDARRELTAISMDLAKRFPQSNAHIRAIADPLSRDLVRNTRTSLWAMFAMVAVILLIACVNVANLLIVRGVSRKREIAIRLALGADRSRIARELLTQSLLLSMIGGAFGLALSAWTRQVLVSLAPANMPRLDQVALDWRVLAASFVLALITGLLFGVLPAWQASRERPVDALRSTDRVVAGTSVMRWRNALMAVEVALSALLLVGAGLTFRSLNAMNGVPLGFRTDHVLVMNVSLPNPKYASPDDRFAFFDRLSERLHAVPGVEHVAFANRLPLRGGWDSGFLIDGQPPPPAGFYDCDFQAVSTGYFDVFGIPTIRGRLIQPGDIKSTQPVAVVSEAFSRQMLNGADPIGRAIRRGPKAPLITIVGVVGDVRRAGKLEKLQPQVYLPAAQTGSYPVRLADVAVRTSGEPKALLPAFQQALWSIDPGQPITSVLALDDVLFQRGAAQRFRALLFGMCAVLALVLSLVGVYGVVSYAVSQRTPEIGVRMALGAARGDILRWLVGGTAALVAGGAVAGLALARLLAHTLDSLLFGITSSDIATYAVAAAALTIVAMGAAMLAARRATLIDPSRALRGE